MNAEARLRPGGDIATTAALPAVTATAAALALGAVAAYSPKAALVALLAVALLVLAVCRLELAVALFVVLTFPEHLPGSLGVGLTLAKPVGATIALAWLGLVVARRNVALLPRDGPTLFWAALGFLALGAASALWATDTAPSFTALGRLAQVAVLLVVVYTAAATPSGFRILLGGYLAGSAATSVYSIATGAYGQNGRLGGLFDPNYFAASLIPAILVSLFVLLTSGTGRGRALAGAVAVVDLAAFALTQSRGGIVGLTVALLAALILAGRARPRVLALVLVLVAAGLGYYTFAAPSHVLSSSSSGRSGEWRIASRMFENHPLRGVGLGNFGVVEPSYSTQTLDLQRVRYVVKFRQRAHNTYLEVAAELGVAGVLLFLLVLGASIRYSLHGIAGLARAEDALEPWARGLVAGAIGMFVAYLFLSAEWEKQLWLVLALLAVVPALVRAEAR
ncbi:MAG: O-antigen ligase family protein [Gaiellaceae bacterium]